MYKYIRLYELCDQTQRYMTLLSGCVANKFYNKYAHVILTKTYFVHFAPKKYVYTFIETGRDRFQVFDFVSNIDNS